MSLGVSKANLENAPSVATVTTFPPLGINYALALATRGNANSNLYGGSIPQNILLTDAIQLADCRANNIQLLDGTASTDPGDYGIYDFTGKLVAHTGVTPNNAGGGNVTTYPFVEGLVNFPTGLYFAAITSVGQTRSWNFVFPAGLFVRPTTTTKGSLGGELPSQIVIVLAPVAGPPNGPLQPMFILGT